MGSNYLLEIRQLVSEIRKLIKKCQRTRVTVVKTRLRRASQKLGRQIIAYLKNEYINELTEGSETISSGKKLKSHWHTVTPISAANGSWAK